MGRADEGSLYPQVAGMENKPSLEGNGRWTGLQLAPVDLLEQRIADRRQPRFQDGGAAELMADYCGLGEEIVAVRVVSVVMGVQQRPQR